MALDNKICNLWIIVTLVIGAFFSLPNSAWAEGSPMCTPPQFMENGVCLTPCVSPQVMENGVCVTPCVPPQVKENGVCVTPCVSPQVMQNGVCVTPCVSPQVMENGVCVTPCVSPLIMENGICVKPCISPQVMENGVCVTPAPTCTAPQVLQNGVCVTPTPTCTAPQVLQGDVCVTPTSTCTPPKVLQDGVCVTPKPTCTAPQELQNGVCVTPTPTCTSPQVLQNNICVTPTPICTAPQVLLDNACVTPSEVQVMQPSTLIASGSFIEPNDAPAEATPMLINDEPLYQFLSSATDEDWFEFYAKAGQRYTIDIPAASIGKMINPVLRLYDASGNLLASQLGQDKQITWTATATGLLRIRVTGQSLSTPKSSAVELKGEAADYSYQIRTFLTDAPHQVLTKGRVLDNCGQGVNEANVSAWLGGVQSGSTLTNKIGEFGLLLNPGNYDLKIVASNFQEATKSVVVGQESTVLAEIKLSPKTTTTGCASNLAAQAQQAPAIYDEQQGGLIIKDIVIDDKVYYVELKNIGDYRFQLAQFFPIPGVIHSDPPEYVPSTLTAKLPKVFALDQIWKIQLRHNGTGVLTLESAETIR